MKAKTKSETKKDTVQYHKSFEADQVAVKALGETIRQSTPSFGVNRLGSTRTITILVTMLIASVFVSNHVITWKSDSATVAWLSLNKSFEVATQSQLLELARVCERHRNLACSQDSYETMIRNSQGLTGGLQIYAEFLLRQNKVRYAQRILESYVGQGGSDADAIHQLAQLQAANGELSSAVQNLRHAINLAPQYKKPLWAHRDLVKLLIQLRQFSDAKLALKDAIRDVPEVKGELLAEIKILQDHQVQTKLAAARSKTAPSNRASLQTSSSKTKLSQMWPKLERKVRRVVVRF